MPEKHIQEIVNKYIALSFSVNKIGEALVKEQLDCDLTSEQHYMLRYIYQKKICTSSELAEVFSVKKSAITAIITRMWTKGFIKRTRDENDRRVVYLTLTDKGNTLYLETEERIHKLVESIISKFEQAEVEDFIKSYEKLHELLVQTKNVQLEG
ncbi:MarR family transcriptional regulator [Bacillus sp. BGMRC 2118]|nr:MarR family transcriptional regulator [Bacillus sp. BGMRC 2118]